MTEQRRPSNAVMGGGAAVLLVVAYPLYMEFSEPGYALWNGLLILFLIGLAVAVFLLQRFFINHPDEVGEARFDTRNKSDTDG